MSEVRASHLLVKHQVRAESRREPPGAERRGGPRRPRCWRTRTRPLPPSGRRLLVTPPCPATHASHHSTCNL